MTPSRPPPDITRLLQAAAEGSRGAAEQLLPALYEELRSLAQARMRQQPPGVTLQATALVHEAYLRVIGDGDGSQPGWDGRAHFFGAAARAMRDILVEQSRRRSSLKRGGDHRREESTARSEPQTPPIQGPDENMEAMDAALRDLEAADPRKAEIAMLMHIAGLTAAEAGAALGVSSRTVEREWRFARVWLQREINRRSAAPQNGGARP